MHRSPVVLALVASSLLAASSSLASAKVLVAPVQATVIPEDLAVELEESARGGAMRAAPGLDLLVMSHATLSSSLADLVRSRRDFAVQLPCKTAECDASLGRALGTNYSVSTRLTKLDGKYLALLKLVDDADDRVVASSSVEADSFGVVLAETGNKVERMFADGLAAKMISKPAAADRIVRAGTVMIGTGGSLLSKMYTCELHTTRLECRASGLFNSGDSLVIALNDVSSVFPDGDRVALTGEHLGTYHLSAFVEMVDLNASVHQQRLAQKRNNDATELWSADLQSAWTAARSR